MKLIRVNDYADIIRENCMKMIDSALAQPTLSSKFNMNVDLKDVLPILKDKAQLMFSERAYAKLVLLVTHNEKEVAAHGTAFRITDKELGSAFLVDDILVYPQEATGGTVDSNDAEYGPWMSRLPDEIFNNLRFQAHSHVRMDVKPSGTDLSFYHRMMQTVPNFYIFFILNKRMEMWCEIYDIERNIYFEDGDVDTTVLLGAGDDSVKFLDSIKQNVIPKVYPTWSGGTAAAAANKPAFMADATKPAADPKPSKKEKKTRGRPRKNPPDQVPQRSDGGTGRSSKSQRCSEPNSAGSGVYRTDGDNVLGTNASGTRTIYNPNFGKAVADYLSGGKQP